MFLVRSLVYNHPSPPRRYPGKTNSKVFFFFFVYIIFIFTYRQIEIQAKRCKFFYSQIRQLVVNQDHVISQRIPQGKPPVTLGTVELFRILHSYNKWRFSNVFRRTPLDHRPQLTFGHMTGFDVHRSASLLIQWELILPEE